MSVKINIICKECGEVLDGEMIDYGTQAGSLSVKPCGKCLAEEKRKGDEEGYERGYEKGSESLDE